jgi:hypothetical protein
MNLSNLVIGLLGLHRNLGLRITVVGFLIKETRKKGIVSINIIRLYKNIFIVFKKVHSILLIRLLRLT